ncbi:hypothetical protein GII30_01295 [Gordonia amarae]|uniref:Dimethylamine monooxygenase subunit DmmA-like C-terminal domain-containing protein n=2 Tax=Gordonia amarae TaxID=36821 RepID=G7GRU6_9ACTN|nr:dimethylamine monooxygenase subunit DmmA family protein [Gordonia amarae]MCS3876981.1 hypothetical protein [Gordonia amarae]QHN15802.1 hypothetical protein GII35_01295 [Gordonia amarae]QHN20370.1 hypothetical protein GII34_01295 [Gordonia amarae]QHN29222.1 hypothetical protein GII32_01300 [Gordonia amarae]QHN38001.1 hypothetical protein GII30_01295 [Gordonia amarae]
MTTQLEYSSVPEWARVQDDSGAELPDGSGAAYIVAGIGGPGTELANRWQDAVGRPVPVTLITADTADDALAPLDSALAASTVGVRLLVAGPAGDCLTVRAHALRAGLEDDEIHVSATGSGPIKVFCSHCRATTTADAGIDDVVPCAGCGRGLLVYYHVSRRKGSYLGFMVDAETVREGT